MPNYSIIRRSWLFFASFYMLWLWCMCGCVAENPAKPLATNESSAKIATATIWQNMPNNEGQRCLGVVTVLNALVHGVPQEDAASEEVTRLAKTIYEQIPQDKPISLPRTVHIGRESFPLASKQSLVALSDEVYKLYKAEFKQLAAKEDGSEQLLFAEDQVLHSTKELNAILDRQHPNYTSFLITGERTLSTGKAGPMYHAVLLGKGPQGKYHLYDPNDPGKSISCELIATPDSLRAKWTCRYMQVDASATQLGSLIHAPQYFRSFREKK